MRTPDRIRPGPARKPHSKRVVPDQRTLAICARIKEARLKRGLSQHKLALHLGLTAGAVGQWDLGRNLPQMAHFDELATILGVSRDWLLTGHDPSERGVAQDITERKALSLMREMSTDGRIAATSFMEANRDLKAGDPLELTHLIEVWVGLPQPKREAASAMIEGLAKSAAKPPKDGEPGGGNLENTATKKPVGRKAPRQTKRKGAMPAQGRPSGLTPVTIGQ